MPEIGNQFLYVNITAYLKICLNWALKLSKCKQYYWSLALTQHLASNVKSLTIYTSITYFYAELIAQKTRTMLGSQIHPRKLNKAKNRHQKKPLNNSTKQKVQTSVRVLETELQSPNLPKENNSAMRRRRNDWNR